MQRTADFHDQIAHAPLPEAAGVVDNTTALDAIVDVLDAHTPAGNAAIRGFLPACEGTASRLLGRHNDVDVRERKRQEAQILEQAAPRGQGVRSGIGNPLIVGTAGVGFTQKQDRERSIDQEHVFYRVALFLAAITARLLSWILGALDAPFGPIVPKRGEAGAGGSAGVSGPGIGATMARASASAIPRRLANAWTDRVGASPNVRSVARRTTRRT
jgi:hypothetical protein